MDRYQSSNSISYQTRCLMCSTWSIQIACWLRHGSRWFRKKGSWECIIYLFVPLRLWQKEMFLRWGHLRGSGELWFRSQPHSPACPWARSFYSFMPQLPQLAKWEQQHRVVLWAPSICELLYPQVSEGQFLNNFILCQRCREGQYGEGSHSEAASSSLQCVLHGRGEFQTLVPWAN